MSCPAGFEYVQNLLKLEACGHDRNSSLEVKNLINIWMTTETPRLVGMRNAIKNLQQHLTIHGFDHSWIRPLDLNKGILLKAKLISCNIICHEVMYRLKSRFESMKY